MANDIKILFSEKDDLFDYAQQVMALSLNDMKTPVFGLKMFNGVGCVVLDRRGQYQAELCVLPPGMRIPGHDHPDVDSIEVQLTGNLRLFINGKDVLRGHSIDGAEEVFQKIGVRIPADADHDATAGDQGVVFLSVQRWKNDVPPSHVALNWKGETFSEEQRHAGL